MKNGWRRPGVLLLLNFLALAHSLDALAATRLESPKRPPYAREVLAPNSVAPTQVIGADDRVPIYSSEKPWNGVGKLVFDGGHCTASLVGEDIILTNAHCVVDDDGKPHSGHKFYPNYMGDTYHYMSGIVDGERGTPLSKDDYAVIRLTSPLGRALGYFGTRNDTVAELLEPYWNGMISLAGYSGDFFRGATAGVHLGCGFAGDAGQMGIEHTCDSMGGSSGGPIFAWIDGKAWIAAINFAHSKVTPTNYAVASATFHPAVYKYRTTNTDVSKYTAVQICNNSASAVISTAMAYLDGQTWVSKGWWNVKRGHCEEVLIAERYASNAYFHAFSEDDEWGDGASNFCVNARGFTNRSASRQCENGRWARFSKPTKMDYRELNTFKFN